MRARKRVVHFRIPGRFDGASAVTLDIDQEADVVSVRPLRRRKAIVVSLTGVVQLVLWREAKRVAAERAKVSKRRGGRREGVAR